MTPKQQRFLAAFIETCSVGKAAKLCKIDRHEHYAWLKLPHYAEAFKHAQAPAADVLEDVAVSRAVDGVQRPVTVAGEREVVAFYSDDLLKVLLKANKPDKYKERQTVEVSWDRLDLDKLPNTQLLAFITQIEEKMQALGTAPALEPAQLPPAGEQLIDMQSTPLEQPTSDANDVREVSQPDRRRAMFDSIRSDGGEEPG